jgi:branched-chain amino acid aminotransferase
MEADEAFLSSTPFCLMPVRSINGMLMGNGPPGPVFRELLRAWSAEVGVEIDRQIIEGAARRRAGGMP